MVQHLPDVVQAFQPCHLGPFLVHNRLNQHGVSDMCQRFFWFMSFFSGGSFICGRPAMDRL